jgi:hypothetical protein
MKKIGRINSTVSRLLLPEDCSVVLKMCANDVAARLPGIVHKINVVQTNIEVVPFMRDGLERMKNELDYTLELQTKINNVIEKYCLNT